MRPGLSNAAGMLSIVADEQVTTMRSLVTSPTKNVLEYGHPSRAMLWPAWRRIATRFAVGAGVLAPLVIWLQICHFEKVPTEDDGVFWNVGFQVPPSMSRLLLILLLLAGLPAEARVRNRERRLRGWRVRLTLEFQQQIWCPPRATVF